MPCDLALEAHLAGEPLVMPCDLALEAHLAAAAGRADFREPAKVGELQRRSALQVSRELEEPPHGAAPPLSPPRAPLKPRGDAAAPVVGRRVSVLVLVISGVVLVAIIIGILILRTKEPRIGDGEGIEYRL